MPADHILKNPQGKVGAGRLITRRAIDRKTQTANFTATCRKRHALRNTKILNLDGAWCHVLKGEVVAKFSSVGEAVAAL